MWICVVLELLGELNRRSGLRGWMELYPDMCCENTLACLRIKLSLSFSSVGAHAYIHVLQTNKTVSAERMRFHFSVGSSGFMGTIGSSA